MRLSLFIVVLFLFSCSLRADDFQNLPSRKTAIVLPLLAEVSSRDNYSKVIQILGKEDYDIGSAYRECIFKLKDSPVIEVKVSLDGKKIYFIRHGNDFIYSSTGGNAK